MGTAFMVTPVDSEGVSMPVGDGVDFVDHTTTTTTTTVTSTTTTTGPPTTTVETTTTYVPSKELTISGSMKITLTADDVEEVVKAPKFVTAVKTGIAGLVGVTEDDVSITITVEGEDSDAPTSALTKASDT